jgi:hypothetical protein
MSSDEVKILPSVVTSFADVTKVEDVRCAKALASTGKLTRSRMGKSE